MELTKKLSNIIFLNFKFHRHAMQFRCWTKCVGWANNLLCYFNYL